MYKYNSTFGLLPKAGKGLVHCANLTKKIGNVLKYEC